MTSVAQKFKIIDDRRTTAITASTNGSSVDARGMVDPKFVLVGVTVDQTTDETYDVKIQGRAKSTDEWADIAGLAFTQQDTSTSYSEQLPTAANAPGVVIPRYIRVVHTLAGTTPSFAGYVGVYYSRPKLGAQIDHGSVS